MHTTLKGTFEDWAYEIKIIIGTKPGSGRIIITAGRSEFTPDIELNEPIQDEMTVDECTQVALIMAYKLFRQVPERSFSTSTNYDNDVEEGMNE